MNIESFFPPGPKEHYGYFFTLDQKSIADIVSSWTKGALQIFVHPELEEHRGYSFPWTKGELRLFFLIDQRSIVLDQRSIEVILSDGLKEHLGYYFLLDQRSTEYILSS